MFDVSHVFLTTFLRKNPSSSPTNKKLNLAGVLHTLRSTLRAANSLDHLVPDAALFLATETRCEALRSAAMVLLKARRANFSPPPCEKIAFGEVH